MSFNEDVSFIEYMVDQPTQDFVINFDTIGGTADAVLITVDDVLTDTPDSTYTSQQINLNTWRITPEVPAGSKVRLYRDTNLDHMLYVFTAGAKFTARNMDTNFKQVRYAQQEVRDDFSKLSQNTSSVLGTFSDRVDALNSEFLTTQGVVADLVDISNTAFSTANTALNVANSIDDKASTALSNSTTALSTAQGIDAKATDALANSLNAVLDAAEALDTANGIDAKATTALSNSTTALTNSNTAISTANGIDAKATEALNTANTALTASSGALKASNNLSDVVSPTTARTNIGVYSKSETDTVIATATPAASTTVKGLIELATQSEVNSGLSSELAVTPATLASTFNAQTKTAMNALGSAPIFACRAWVNFNGTGTVAIRGSGNVSSITDNGVGDYTVNFTAAMQDINYSVIGSGNLNNTESWSVAAVPSGVMTTSFRVLTKNVEVGGADLLSVNLAVFR